MNALKTYDEIYDKVKTDYMNDSVELNGLFFDFEVNATYETLLKAYTDLQHDINGDDVLHLSDIEIYNNDEDDDEKLIWGHQTDDTEEFLAQTYKGNMRDFLESFNDNEKETGWCRVYECNEQDDSDKIGGTMLMFVF